MRKGVHESCYHVVTMMLMWAMFMRLASVMFLEHTFG